jgi:hypothetical protein
VTTTPSPADGGDIVDLTTRLHAAESLNELLTESFADMELAAEDRSWTALNAIASQEFTRSGLTRIAINCRIMAVASPLVKRGLQLRNAYIWGQGVSISARDAVVNEVVQDFLGDQSNLASLTGSQAREELERALGTDGQVFLAAFTSRLTGRVQIRSTPLEEIQDIIFNPEDRDEPWFYLRQYSVVDVEAGSLRNSTRTVRRTKRTYHPALNWSPTSRPASIDGVPVNWDAPILHVSANRLDGATWGIPDAYAGLTWARAYEDTLTDWAKLVKSLSRFAWRLSGDKSARVRDAAARLRSNLPAPGSVPGGDPAGGTFASGGIGAASLEAIPKTGATIDANSARPLAAMVAASFGVPVTMLLSDPGVTGARATAETLDDPMVLEMNQRRDLWADAYDRIFAHLILQSVKAPQGVLRGSITRDEWGRESVQLAEGLVPRIEIAWPSLKELDPKSLVESIKLADDTGVVPGEVILRQILTALKVRNIEDIMERATDEDGVLIAPEAAAAVEAFAALRARHEVVEAS